MIKNRGSVIQFTDSLGVKREVDIRVFENVRDNLRLHLVSKKFNPGLMERMPYREFLDLAVIVVLEFPFDDECAMVDVTYQLLDLWKKSFDDVFWYAHVFLKSESPIIMDSSQISDEQAHDRECEDIKMYVVSNKNTFHGAIQMFNDAVLRDFSMRMRSDIVVIPSSIHEIIFAIVPEELMDMECFDTFVKDVNKDALPEKEWLSDHVYLYRLFTGWEF